MAILSSVPATSLHAQFSSPSHEIRNQMGSFSVGMFPNLPRSSSSIAVKRQKLQIQVLLKGIQPPEVAGFGSQRGGGKGKHRLVILDPAKVEEVQKYELFARKFATNAPVSKWEPIGDILLEKGADLEMALKERRKKLFTAAQYQYPSFLLLSAGEEIQYGYREAVEESKDDITLVDVKGKELTASIPALLRVDDGVKPLQKRF